MLVGEGTLTTPLGGRPAPGVWGRGRDAGRFVSRLAAARTRVTPWVASGRCGGITASRKGMGTRSHRSCNGTGLAFAIEGDSMVNARSLRQFHPVDVIQHGPARASTGQLIPPAGTHGTAIARAGSTGMMDGRRGQAGAEARAAECPEFGM